MSAPGERRSLRRPLVAVGLLGALLSLGFWLLTEHETGEPGARPAGTAAVPQRSASDLERALESAGEGQPAPQRAAPFKPKQGRLTQARVIREERVEQAPVQIGLRAFDATGRAVTDSELRVTVAVGSGVRNSFVLRTDVLGYARTPEFLPREMIARIRVSAGLSTPSADGLFARGERGLERLVAGVNELGDFVLRTPREEYPEPLVEGRVLDEAGAPIADVVVQWTQGVSDPDRAAEFVPSGSYSVGYRDSGRGGEGSPLFWAVAPGKQSTRTDEDGRFQIWGPVPWGGITLVETGPPRGMPVLGLSEFPARDVVWRAGERLRVRGRLVVTEGLDPRGLTVGTVTGVTERSGMTYSMTPEADGSFELWCGSAVFKLCVYAGVEIPGLEVWSSRLEGATSGTLDLGEIDLRESVRGVRVGLRDGAGLALAGADLSVRTEVGVVYSYGLDLGLRSDDSGAVEFFVPSGTGTVEFDVGIGDQTLLYAPFVGAFGPYSIDEVPAVLTVE